MPVVDRSYGGSAVRATLQTAMTALSPGAGGTITVSDDSGYPVTGKFEIVIDREQTNEESILISSRSGTTFTIGQRAYDSTTASSHTSGQATVELDLSARTVQLFVDHVDDVEADPHSTKLLNNTRHDVEARHQFGGALGTPVAPTDIATAAAAGTGNNPAKEDHAHKVGSGAINSSAMFAAGVVDSSALGALSVTAGKLGANSVGNVEILDGQVGSGELATGAVIAGKIAAGGVSAASQIADAIITLTKMAAENPTAKGGTNWNNVTIGSGGVDYNSYLKIGKLVVGLCGFTLGTGGNVTGTIQAQLPFVAGQSPIDGVFAGRAFDASGSSGASGLGIILDGEQIAKNLVTLGTSSWDATVPFNWDPGDTFRGLYIYFTA